MNINRKVSYQTYEGGRASLISPEQELRRSVLSCFLWESQFYENGQNIADRIRELVKKVSPEFVARLAIEARHDMYLRHVPLLLVRELARHPKAKGVRNLVKDTVAAVIKRPDDMTELLAIYWQDGRTPIDNAIKRGMRQAFAQFDRYQLAKYSGYSDRKRLVTVRDIMFLVHPKPKDEEQAEVFRLLADQELEPPETWEVLLSTGADKRETFERLLREHKLGGLAFLRNLRNMLQSGVDESLIKAELARHPFKYVLPFRFIAAARYAPSLEPEIEAAMMRTMAQMPTLPGKTVLLVDVSGSMDWPLSDRSDLIRMDAGCGLAMIARERCEGVRIFSFSDVLIEIPPRHGFALRDAIVSSQDHQGTYLGKAVTKINALPYDRLIVFTDEQAHDNIPNPAGTGYIINVASYKRGVGYGAWSHVDGFSENVFRWITEFEKLEGGEDAQ